MLGLWCLNRDAAAAHTLTATFPVCVQQEVDAYFRDICASGDLQKVELVVLSTLVWDTHTATVLDYAYRFCALVHGAVTDLPDVLMAEIRRHAAACVCGEWLPGIILCSNLLAVMPCRCAAAEYELLVVPLSELGLCCFLLALRACGHAAQLDATLFSIQLQLPGLQPPRPQVIHAVAELYSRLPPAPAGTTTPAVTDDAPTPSAPIAGPLPSADDGVVTE